MTTNKERRGKNRCHVAVTKEHTTTAYALDLLSSGSRIRDDKICSELIIDVIHQACNPPVATPDDKFGMALLALLETAEETQGHEGMTAADSHHLPPPAGSSSYSSAAPSRSGSMSSTCVVHAAVVQYFYFLFFYFFWSVVLHAVLHTTPSHLILLLSACSKGSTSAPCSWAIDLHSHGACA